MLGPKTIKIAKELARNFILPCIISLMWAAFRVYESKPDSPVSSFIANFSGALFLSAWAIGQYKRVQKQLSDEAHFESLSARVELLISKMEESTTQLIGYTLGGSQNLNIYVGTDQKNPLVATFSLENPDAFPVFDVKVMSANLDPLSNEFRMWRFDTTTIPTIRSQAFEPDVLKLDMTDDTYQKILIYVTWRNGSFTKIYEVTRNGAAISFQPIRDH